MGGKCRRELVGISCFTEVRVITHEGIEGTHHHIDSANGQRKNIGKNQRNVWGLQKSTASDG